MAKKTVIRRHAKSLPQSGDIVLTDVEADDMSRAAKSAVALLDSRRSEAPQLVDAEPFDPETGELPPLDAATQTIPVDGEPEPEPSYPPGTPTKPKGRPGAPEAKPTAPPENKDDQPEATPEEIETAPKDESGFTKMDVELLADDLIARARGCELLVDLGNLEKMAEFDLATMPPQLAASVDTEFGIARKRLTPPAKDKAS
jgi:recombination protein RecT